MIELFVAGHSVAQGRPRGFKPDGCDHTVFTDPVKSRNWKKYVKHEITALLRKEHPDWKLMDGAIELNLRFVLARPKSVSEKKRPFPIVKPDLKNLLSAVEDACNGVLWHDDNQVVCSKQLKIYGDPPGVYIAVRQYRES